MRKAYWFVLGFFVISAVLEILAGRVVSRPIIFLRILRLTLGITAGAVLGSTGAALQRIYNNPLADGYILGISGGAVLGVALSEFLNVSFDVVAALVGALVVGVVVIWTTRRVARTLVPVIGIGIGMFFSSLAVLLFMMAGVEASRTFYALWGTLGRFYEYSELPFLLLLSAVSMVGILLLSKYHRHMDAVSLGELESLALGYDPKSTVFNITLISSLLVALVTAFVGVIGFVGIMSAHILRGLGIREGRNFYLASGVVGASLVILSDATGRLILGIDPPIGIIMSILGAPLFVYISRSGS
ncbi:MAG: iron ABC transporter permease [Thermotogae bacterium]|nr:iron ABC transporter permease [Thermotogota bacterium]